MELMRKVCYFVSLVFLTIPSDAGNSRYFVTENCGQVVGPDYGAYLEFDREAKMVKGNVLVPDHLRGQEFECIIVVRGMPTTGEKRYMAIHMRSFHLKEQGVTTPQNEVAKCGKAYMIVYNGMDRTAPEKYVFCGADARVMNLEWVGEYMTFYFYIDYRNPDLSTQDPLASPLPPNANDVTTVATPTTTPDPFPYPTVYFKMDISSFDYECNETIDKVVLKCNDSRRCLDDSLKCDFWFSRNCPSDVYPRDNTDTSRQPPASCFRKPTTTTTTTTIPPPPFKPDFTPIYAAVGGVLSVLMLLWCCWKPAYLPWRVARCRNYPCWVKCGNLCPCLKCRFCFPGPSSMSPTGAAAWREAKLQRGSLISQDMSDLSPLGPGPYSISGYPESQHGEHYIRRYGSHGEYPTENDINGVYHGGGATSKGIIAQLCPCLSNPAVSEGTSRKSIKSGQVAPFPNARGSIPNGGPLTQNSFERSTGPYNRNPRNARNGGNSPPNPQADLDAMALANNWMKMVAGDGSHLREQR